LFDIGSGELLLIAVVALLLFGGRLPDVARNLGRMVSDFKRGLAEGTKPLREVGTQIEREIAETGTKPDATGSRPPGMGRPGGGSV
jgi:sec-independent protein translocase protein TatA